MYRQQLNGRSFTLVKTMTSAVENLRTIARSCQNGNPLPRDLSTWLGNSLERLLSRRHWTHLYDRACLSEILENRMSLDCQGLLVTSVRTEAEPPHPCAKRNKLFPGFDLINGKHG